LVTHLKKQKCHVWKKNRLVK